MKYKAMMHDHEIFINFVHAIHSMYLDEDERAQRNKDKYNLGYGKIPTKEELQELRKTYNNKQISELTGWSYKKINYYVTKYKLGKW